jgi:hypothetical protein
MRLKKIDFKNNFYIEALFILPTLKKEPTRVKSFINSKINTNL